MSVKRLLRIQFEVVNNDQSSIVNSRRVSGLKVREYFLQEEIKLPPAYTREYIPLEKNNIPTHKTVET